MKLLFLLVALVVAGLWITSAVISRGIEQQFPPIGESRLINGAVMHYVDSGAVADEDKPAILFIHGASSNLRDVMSANDGRLEDRFRVIYVDRPGHGYSQPFAGSNDPQQQANAIAGLMESLAIPKAVIVGHSFGGAVASTFAVLHPDKTAGLVLVAPVSHPWTTGIAWHYDVAAVPGLGWVFTQLLAAPFGSLIYPGAVEAVFAPDPQPADFVERSGTRLVLRPSNFLENARDVAGLLDHVRRFQSRYREIKVPTVIFHGDADTTVNLEIHSVNGLSQDIAGAQLHILEGMGHMPTYFIPDQIAESISDIADMN